MPGRASFIRSALFYLLFAIVLSRVPLLNYLGYEFSAAVALCVPWIAGFGTIRSLRLQFGKDRPSARVYRHAVARNISFHLMLLLLPYVIITLNTLIVRNCSYVEGLAFYLLLPCVTVPFSVVLAGLCWLTVRRPRRTFIALLLLILLHPLIIGYVTPQIFSYNPIYGFFPGITYDEVLKITPQLILFRGLTLVGAVWCLLAGMMLADRRFSTGCTLITCLRDGAWSIRSFSLIACSIVLIAAWIWRGPLRFETGEDLIRATLTEERRTDHFVIRYAPDSFSGDEIDWLVDEHEFRYMQLSRDMKVNGVRRIVSYVYPDAETKRRFIGAGATNIAKPWRAEIHMNRESWNEVLKHELVHVLAGEFGMPLIRAHYHLGLVEGLATAAVGDFGNRTLHEYAAGALRFGMVGSPRRMINPIGFATQASTVSYILMGSFCRYLLDRYGIVPFKELYSGKAPRIIYGKSYDELFDEWEHYLLRVDVPETWRPHISWYVRRPSIFAKECPRTVARLNQEGWKALGKSDVSAAERFFSKSLDESWNTEAFTGLVRSAFRLGKVDTVVRLMASAGTDENSATALGHLAVIHGDALWYRGETRSASAQYNGAMLLDLSEASTAAAATRLAMMREKIFARFAPRYAAGTMTDSVTLVELDSLQSRSASPLIPFLKAAIFFHQGKYDRVLRYVEESQLPLDIPILHTIREEMAGVSLVRCKRYQDARIRFWESMNTISSAASRQRVEDWLDRCEWYSSREESRLK